MSSEWFIEGWTDGKRRRFYFKTEEAAKTSANERNEEIAAFGARYVISDDDRRELVAVRKLLGPGESLIDVVRAYAEQRDKKVTSVSIKDFCETVRAEFERRAAKGEITPRHYKNMRPMLKPILERVWSGAPNQIVDRIGNQRLDHRNADSADHAQQLPDLHPIGFLGRSRKEIGRHQPA